MYMSTDVDVLPSGGMCTELLVDGNVQTCTMEYSWN